MSNISKPKKPVEQFTWEKPHEYEYRNETGKLSLLIQEAMNTLDEIAKAGGSDFIKLKEIMDKCNKKVKYLTVPSMYENAHGFLVEAITAYTKAVDILIEAAPKKDSTQIRKSARYIKEGNSFINITKSRIWGAIEDRIAEN